MVRANALWASLVVGGVVIGIRPAAAGISAASVLSYNAGVAQDSYWGTPYTVSSGALGTPNLTENVPDVFDSGGNQIAFADNSAITPFNAQYNPQNVVALSGVGGSITLQLSSPVVVGVGAALGIHVASGLEDASYPAGQNLNPAVTYSNPRQADLQVSADDIHWIDLGDQTFNNPTSAYSDETDPTGVTPGTVVANVFQPFYGSLANFNGESFTQTLATLAGSAGGNWFDLSGIGLSDVDYVRLTTSAGETMFLDAVVADSGTSGGSPTSPTSPGGPSAVPLPSALWMGLTALPLAGLFLGKRRAAVR